MARANGSRLGSWLSGPGSDLGPNDYPGQRLGLPETGPESIARFGRRIGALLIDWFIAYGLVGLAVGVGLVSRDDFLYTPMGSTSIALVWVLLGIISVRLFGFTPGQYALGLRVASVDHRVHVGLGRATVRMLLVFFVIPALFTDGDFRGYQDRFTNTAVVRR
ncbi:RDD family protein [Mycolicibacterium pulveris]|uniref:RDD family protein n=1 Tax=Mycolicibacterium pulveris TaxID=36813 RepID=UPI003CE9E89F